MYIAEVRRRLFPLDFEDENVKVNSEKKKDGGNRDNLPHTEQCV